MNWLSEKEISELLGNPNAQSIENGKFGYDEVETSCSNSSNDAGDFCNRHSDEGHEMDYL